MSAATRVAAALALAWVAIASSDCDATRRDPRKCYQHACPDGTRCNKDYVCVPSLDGGIDTADAALPDVPLAVDVAALDGPPAYDGLPDVPIFPDVSEADTTFDGAAIDAAVDGRTIDAPGSCDVDNDCVAPHARFCVGGLCVACKSAAECSGDTPLCSSTHSCVSCAAIDAGCPNPTPVCEAFSGRCVECLADGDCAGRPTKSFCVNRACVACSGAEPLACATRDPSKPLCLANGTCGDCASSAECGVANKPICDTAAGLCTACTSDSQCEVKGGGTGVCLADGHCATTAETVYVGRTAVGACSDLAVNAGSLPLPFCSADKAVAAGKPVVIVLNDLADSFALGTLASTPLTIVGRNGVITARADTDAISLLAGELTVRGLTITGNPASNRGIGIDVQASLPRPATVHIEGCTISKHANGGVFLSGAAFEIRNTTVTKNGRGQTADGVVWSGIRIDKVATAGAMSLGLVTISDNASVGLSCASAVQGQGVLATGNSPNITTSCGFSSCAAASTGCGSQL